MNAEVQIEINSDQRLKKFLRENSYWYKYLNRNPDNLKYLFDNMKEAYKQNTSDKIAKTIENLSLIQSILNVLKS